MSYLNRFFQEAFDGSDKPQEFNSFEAVTDEQLAAHLKVNQYDSFQLTEAVRPAMDLKICLLYTSPSTRDRG